MSLSVLSIASSASVIVNFPTLGNPLRRTQDRGGFRRFDDLNAIVGSQ